MRDSNDIFARAADAMASFRATVDQRPVAPPVDFDAIRDGFGTALPADPSPPRDVLDELLAAADPGIMATAGPRYFGFVIGGALESATAADMLALGWDQPAFNATLSPAAIAAEQVAGGWAKELLGIPATASVGFVTGAQEANTVGLAAARHHVLAERGWDVEQDGLQGAPRMRVVVGDERHATIDRSLRLLGLGTARPSRCGRTPTARSTSSTWRRSSPTADGPDDRLPAGGQREHRRLRRPRRPARPPTTTAPGCTSTARSGCGPPPHPDFRHLTAASSRPTRGAATRTSGSTSPTTRAGLRLPAGRARRRHVVRRGLPGRSGQGTLGGSDFVLGSSRRARGFAVWAAIRELGRSGVADLVERTCSHARRFADQLRGGRRRDRQRRRAQPGAGRLRRRRTTDAVIDRVQRDGTCWMGGTTWRGRRYMRISVSNHATTEADVDRSVEAVLRCWRRIATGP